MKSVDVFGYRRTCVLCLRSKPMKGAITFPRFICCECREKRESRRAARAATFHGEHREAT